MKKTSKKDVLVRLFFTLFYVKFISLPLNNLLMPNLLTTASKGDIMSVTAKNVEISKRREV